MLGYPRRGLVWRWSRGRAAAQRILVEDSLKHFHDCEYAQFPVTVSSLAGALEIGRDEASRLAARLGEMGLVTRNGRGFLLTPEGRSYALRVIRIHRLWERYLADRTGYDEAEWHREAELKEHTMTAEQAEALASELGNPTYDPHGAPIPTADGGMPTRRGIPLSSLKAGAMARIIHVEDEPDAVYAQIVAARLHLGVAVRVLESAPDRMRVEAELQEHVLAPVVAANVTVEPIGDTLEEAIADSRLSELPVGQQATVVDISPACLGVERRRLLDLGVVPGTVVQAELESAGGDPVAYRIRGAMIALRREQADLIRVRSCEQAAAT
jgi:DtxR family Mn-dependent transcriptional regulator